MISKDKELECVVIYPDRLTLGRKYAVSGWRLDDLLMEVEVVDDRGVLSFISFYFFKEAEERPVQDPTDRRSSHTQRDKNSTHLQRWYQSAETRPVGCAFSGPRLWRSGPQENWLRNNLLA